MNTGLDPRFAAALRRELVALPSGRRTHRRRVVIFGAGLTLTVALGGVAAAGLRPANDVATPALAPPVIVNGVGPASVLLPDAPRSARYLQVELACFDGPRCATVGGSVGGDGPKVQRQGVPVTEAYDPQSAQELPPLDPQAGLGIDVAPGTDWRLYAVYTDRLDPRTASLPDGRTLGVPGLEIADLVPAKATNGRSGWVDYHLLTGSGSPDPEAARWRLELPVYDADGVTQIGVADIGEPSAAP